MNKSLLKETRQHGNPAYPASTYHIECPPGQPLLDLHWHDELEFLMVTRGTAVFRIEMEDYEVRAGEAIFVGSGELHSGSVAGHDPCAFSAVVFHPDLFGGSAIDVIHQRFVRPLMDRRSKLPSILTRHSDPGAELLPLLDRLFTDDREKPYGYELATRGILQLCLSLLLRNAKPADDGHKPEGDPRVERLKEALEYIERRYAEPIQLRELAGAVSMSEAYFCRFFKRMTSKSPIAYINLYRVRLAAAMLRQSDKKVMEIALEVGFNNMSYFNTVFKQQFGCTPVEYRRQAVI